MVSRACWFALSLWTTQCTFYWVCRFCFSGRPLSRFAKLSEAKLQLLPRELSASFIKKLPFCCYTQAHSFLYDKPIESLENSTGLSNDFYECLSLSEAVIRPSYNHTLQRVKLLHFYDSQWSKLRDDARIVEHETTAEISIWQDPGCSHKFALQVHSSWVIQQPQLLYLVYQVDLRQFICPSRFDSGLWILTCFQKSQA